MNVEFSDVKNIISSLAFRFSIAAVSDRSKWYNEERKEENDYAFSGITSRLVTGAILER